jgi:eukaryotic-like serine/threonine-protein kinase
MSMHRPVRRLAAFAFTTAALWLAAAPLMRAAAQEATAYELAIVDSRGKKQVLGKVPATTVAPRVSIDDKLALGISDAGAPARVWVSDLDAPDKRKALAAAGPAANLPGIWSADGKHLYVAGAGNGADVTSGIYKQNGDGTGKAERVADGVDAQAVTPDDKQLVVLTQAADGDIGLNLVDLAGGASSKLANLPGSPQQGAAITPDGKWVAYTSNDTGRNEIWIEKLSSLGQRYKLTPDGGQHPVWSSDGYQVYYDHDGQIYRLFVFLDKEKPQTGELEKLPITGFVRDDKIRNFELLSDGVRLLMLFPVK